MITALLVGMAIVAADEGKPELAWQRTRIGDTTYEAAAVFDVDSDGHLDIVSGGYWHAGPEFKEQFYIWEPKREGDYYDDFSDYPMDINGDGHLDIVTGGWWSEKAQWLQNPGTRDGVWTMHDIGGVGNVERNTFYDLDNDGLVEVIPNSTKRLAIFKLVVDAQGKGTGKFDEYTVRDGAAGHGQGFGDLNHDGRVDIILIDGWYEQAEGGISAPWIWHGGEYNFGTASVPVLACDVNKDGLNDVIVGQGHSYGMDWYEQKKDGDARSWIKHEIEPLRSQFHDMAFADVDNDNELEVVTGKRWRAHPAGDPGGDDPIGIYYYEINGGDFVRHTLDYGPPETASGAGIYLWVEDVDGDGWKDIVAPGKQGLYLFKNLGKIEG